MAARQGLPGKTDVPQDRGLIETAERWSRWSAWSGLHQQFIYRFSLLFSLLPIQPIWRSIPDQADHLDRDGESPGNRGVGSSVAVRGNPDHIPDRNGRASLLPSLLPVGCCKPALKLRLRITTSATLGRKSREAHDVLGGNRCPQHSSMQVGVFRHSVVQFTSWLTIVPYLKDDRRPPF